MPSNEEDTDYINLQEYLLVLKRRWLAAAIVMGSVFGITAFVTFSQKPIYEASGKLLLKQNEASNLTGLNQKLGELSGLTNTSNPLETEAEVIRSNPLVKKIINGLEMKDKKGKPLEIDAFLKSLKVKSVKGTDVMELTYRGTNPLETAKVINTLMNNYLENNIRSNRTEVTAARDFLRKQLPEIERKVVEAEISLRRFKDDNKVISLPDEAKVGVEGMRNIAEESTRALAMLEEAKSRSATLQEQLELTTKKAVELSTLSQTPGIQQVLTEYQKVQDELAVAKSRFTEEHPSVRNLVAKEQAFRQQMEKRVGRVIGVGESVKEQDLQIGELKQSLTGELVKSEVERLAVQQRVQVLQNAYTAYESRMRDLPKLEQRQRALERRLQVAQTTYQQVQKQLQEVEVVEQQKVGNARIVSEALVPEKPVSPKVPLNLALGGFLGLLLGAGTALLLEALDKSLKNVDEAKRLLGYPLLGTVPNLAEKGKMVTEIPARDNPYSSGSMAFEMLMTNLAFSVSDKELRVIVVTSSVPSEGKSTVAANLAVAKAQLGKRVLLIDADMRRPRQHEIWELQNFMGLSNALVGQGEWVNLTKEVVYGLDVLTAGTIPPNPLPLVDSQSMATLIRETGKDYDFVIIDTPPLTLASEAQLLGKMADGVLLVVRPGIANVNTVAVAKGLLEQSSQRVLGMVVNGVNVDSGSGYYYNKGYYGRKGSEKVEMDGKGVKLPGIKIG
jgi:polysaccharide biosynthesis transport protein